MRASDNSFGKSSQFPIELEAMRNGLMAGYDQTPDTEEDPQKILAHFDPEELLELDNMQGGILIDPETNLREYTPLAKLLRNPEIRESISQVLNADKDTSFLKKFAMGGEVEPGKPFDPELEKLRLEGRKGDTELAIITPELLEIFSEWMGKEADINPTTGLPEFFNFGRILRWVAPVLGAVLGGPVGAALAGGLTTKLTGGSWGRALGSAALGGLGALAAPAIGGAFQNTFPGFSAGLGNATRGLLGQNVGGALTNLFTPSTGGGIVGGLSSVGNMAPAGGIEQIMLQKARESAFPEIAGGEGTGLLGNLLSKGLPLIGSGLLMSKGHKEEQKGLREYQRALENRENRDRQEMEGMRERHGFNAPLNPVRPFKWNPTNDLATADEMKKGIVRRNFDYDLVSPYAHGGAIRGHGKGQQDNIRKNIPENSYILDASTVSDIGDGSSGAGIQELDRFFSRLPSHKISNNSKGGYIKAMVSNDEYEISPEKVSALGKGSNEKGAQILKKLVSDIRSSKRTSGSRLPPKAKPINGYLKRINS